MNLADGLSALLIFLIGFGKAAAWSCLLAGVFVLFGLPIKGIPLTNGLWWLGIVGGFLFGMGAAINGGCSLSTVQQLADGDTSVLLTLSAFVAGVVGVLAIENRWLSQVVQVQPLWWWQLTPAQHISLVTVLLLWAARELVMQWRRRNPSLSIWQRLAAPRYRLSFGVLLLGVCSGLLFLLEGAWTHTNYLREETKSWLFDGIAPGWLRGVLVMTLFLGMLVSSIHRSSFRWRLPVTDNWLKRSVGGVLMGAGGALVPGGNDTLILVLIPTLSIQAVASYVALLAGIASAVLGMRLVRGART